MPEALWAIEHIWLLANNSEQWDNRFLQLNIYQKRCFESVIIHIDPGTEDLYMMSCLTSTIASACSQADQSAGGQGLDEFIQCFKVNDFLNYELFLLTILRFTRHSTDRRDCCIGNQGAITFKVGVHLVLGA